MWQRTRRWLLWILLVMVLGPFVAFAVGWFVFKTPTADDAITQVARFTYANPDDIPVSELPPEAILASVSPANENRVKVVLDDVPPHVRNAVLAAEDSTFYSNPGFDITGIARAIYNQLTGGVGGGSTITQQYVKVSTGQDEATLIRKYKEVVLAVKISREQTKDQILENYLNTIYFGRGAYGIQAASRAYFDKDVGDLSVSEGAMLAGLIQAPSRWAPSVGEDGTPQTADAERRWTFVVDQMNDKGWLAPGERPTLTFPATWTPKAPEGVGVPSDDRYHLYDKARAELEGLGITEDQINTLGLTVTTTIDPARQAAAADAVREIQADNPDNLRYALASVDPRTGAIQAYYGGDNGVGNDYAEARRQPGSSFKPFVFAAAMEADEDVGLGSTYDGTSGQRFPGVPRPINNSGDSSDCGSRCSVKTAMTKSVNTVFYQMAIDVGPANVIDTAHAAGIPDDLLTGQPSAGIALGDQEVRTIDMASAFGTFATDGQRHDPYIVSRVEAADGRVLFERDPPEDGPAEIPADIARTVTESMLDVARSSSIGLSGGRPVAAKTGTVQNPAVPGQNKDAWTVGYTPSLSTAVWVGSDASDAIKDASGRAIYGRNLPGKIWQQYMNAALKGVPSERFSPFTSRGTPLTSSSDTTGSATPSTGSSESDSDEDEEDNGEGGSSDSGGRGGPFTDGNLPPGREDDEDTDEESADVEADQAFIQPFSRGATPTAGAGDPAE